MVSLKHVGKNVPATVISLCSERNTHYSGFVARHSVGDRGSLKRLYLICLVQVMQKAQLYRFLG